ncbi:MH2 domain containing protein [Asbolus verrucosus]|uniref:MH2 domain containing protein n=1 Tax=Asbolus verrucosus TaxID=1661398 RepID=A0A482W8Q2_ASBVE|nr:MH2 domain containing protein [Asbolus verrucosus]
MKTFPHRFLLDELANPDRSLDVINVRQQIGGGVRLHRVGGQLFAECKSEAAIFVHSRYYNRTRGYDPAKICRMHMSRGRLMTLFEDDQFDKWLADAEGYEAVRQLAKMCTIRISFVRGWGKWNKEDPLLTNVPCWIEIKLQRPLDKIHEVVQQMRTLHKMYC